MKPYVIVETNCITGTDVHVYLDEGKAKRKFAEIVKEYEGRTEIERYEDADLVTSKHGDRIELLKACNELE